MKAEQRIGIGILIKEGLINDLEPHTITAMYEEIERLREALGHYARFEFNNIPSAMDYAKHILNDEE